MGWEKRGGKVYYYRKRRVGGRVISDYIGAGPHAELIADLDDLARVEAEAEREAWRQECDAMLADDQRIDEAGDLVRMLTRAWLLAYGYHTHKGQWRKKRE